MVDDVKTSEGLKAEKKYNTVVEEASDYIEHFDILETITNVGNDEVFTPRKTAEMMLNSLPEEVWHNPNYKWLNPATKNGIFEREIALRLDEGLKDVIPDKEERRKHILQNMIYSIGLTKFTANVARRTVYYCSEANRTCDGIKAPDGHYVNGYSIGNGTWFNDSEGNIKTPNTNHSFKQGKCEYCGIKKDSKYVDSTQREQYAYEFIHIHHLPLKRILQDRFFKGDRTMKFDIIIGNPPYQLSAAKIDDQQNAVPIYDLFVEQAISLEPKYISMIIPSRWLTGGRGLDDFREKMFGDDRISLLHDFMDASECFPTVEIKGGVCYFLWDRDHHGKLDYYNHKNGVVQKSKRALDDMHVGLFVRDKDALSIIRKVTEAPGFKSFEAIAGSQTPFGIVTSFKDYTEQPTTTNTMKIYGNKFVGYTSMKHVTKNHDLANKYKVFAPKAVGDGLIENDKVNAFVPDCPSICTQTYIIYGSFDNKTEAENLAKFMSTKFFHFLLGQLKNTQQMAPNLFKFVPLLDFKEEWTDQKLFKKYNLTEEEIAYIKKTVNKAVGV